MSSSSPKLKAKDIPDDVMLDLIMSLENVQAAYLSGKGFESFKRVAATLYDICNLWPTIPQKVIRSKLKSLIKKGKIDGCVCGCSGNFNVLQKE